MKEKLVLIQVLAALTLVSCGGGGGGQVAVGAQAPGFRLESLDGETVSLESFRGSPVILTFWATWCQPCLKEIPIFNSIEAGSKAKVVSVSLDDEGLSVVQPFVQQHGLNYPVLLGNQEVFMRFGGIGIPYTLLLSGSGTITKIYSGTVERETLEADLESALGAS